MKLKSLFLVSLFSFLLIPSFSSAVDNVYIEDVPSDFVIGNYSYSVDNNINFITNSTGNFIEYKYTPSYNQFYHFFGWIDNKLYYVSYDIQQVQGYLQGRQGFINSFCSTNNLTSRCTNFNVSAEDFYSMSKNITKIAIGIFGNDYADPFGLCFYNSLDELYYCAQGSYATFSNSNYYSSLTGSIGFNSADSIRNYDWGSSPFSSSSNYPSVVNPRESAQNIYDSYRRMGYSDVLCYGGFGLNDKFGTGNSSLNGIKIGSGAFITDLYNSYPYDVFDGSSLNIVDWYNSWDFEYGFFIDQHDLNEFSYYDGLSRGFVGLFLARDYFFKGSNFDPATLISFCEFSLANDILIDKSQTPIDIVRDTINETELNKLIGNIGVIKPGTGSALDVIARFISGYNEDDYYSLFLSGFETIDSIEIPTTEYPGILPNYIIVGFLGIMLLYVLKH